MEVWHSWFEYSCIHVATAALAPGDVTTECSAIKIHDTRARKPVTLINIYVPPVRTSYGRNQGFNPDFLPGLPDTFILGDFNATWFLVLSVQVPGLTYLFIHVQQEGPKDMNTHTDSHHSATLSHCWAWRPCREVLPPAEQDPTSPSPAQLPVAVTAAFVTHLSYKTNNKNETQKSLHSCRPVGELLSGYYNCDSTSIQLRFDYEEKWTCSFFVAPRGVVASKKAVGWAYNDVIVYITVIRMAFTLTDQHRVASSDCRRWYSPFTHFRSKMTSGINSCLH